TITSKVSERLNIKVAQKGTPAISPEMTQAADPALLAAIMQSSPAAAKEGGVDPEVMAEANAQQQGGGQAAPPIGAPGPLPGDAMPENRLGEAVAMAQGGTV
ncbi:MAG TPA: hypothetical protein VHQ86_04065, partial [Candidatus Saccharimonadia bacterium]|nr:hypothetical protein [Candidatus Saccharimonadia bacterium]